MINSNKHLIVKLFKEQWKLRNWNLYNFDDYYDTKLIVLIDICDRLQKNNINTIDILNRLLSKDLNNNLLTVNGILKKLSQENNKIFKSVLNTKLTENYIKNMKNDECNNK